MGRPTSFEIINTGPKRPCVPVLLRYYINLLFYPMRVHGGKKREVDLRVIYEEEYNKALFAVTL